MISKLPPELQKPMEDLVDGFLYLGPQDLRLREPMPADIALDADFRAEIELRQILMLWPGAGERTPQEIDQQIVNRARNPLFAIPKPPDMTAMKQNCLDRKNSSNAPQ